MMDHPPAGQPPALWPASELGLYELRGHQAPISCMTCYHYSDDFDNITRGTFDDDISDKDKIGGKRSILVTGSEDNTVRLWDLESRKCFKCIHRCFTSITGIEAVLAHPLNPHVIIVAEGDNLMTFNISGKEVLLSTALSQLMGVASEISCLAVTVVMTNNESSTLLAIGDSNGHIHIVSIDSYGLLSNDVEKGCGAITAAHSNLVGSLLFQHHGGRILLMSGGFDCSCRLWDISNLSNIKKIRECQFSNLNLEQIEGSTSQKQIHNPPFVFAIQEITNSAGTNNNSVDNDPADTAGRGSSTSCISEKSVAVALGDGTVSLIHQ